MATDEEVLGRTGEFLRARTVMATCRLRWPGALHPSIAFGGAISEMRMIFRDHTISDLIGLCTLAWAPQDAAAHIMHNIKQSASNS